MIKAKSVKSTLWVEFVKNNIKGEDQTVLLNLILQLSKMIISAYIPDSKIAQTYSEFFNVIYE